MIDPILEPYLSPRSRYDPPSQAPPPEIPTPTPMLDWGPIDIPSPPPIITPPPRAEVASRRIDGINLETGETYFGGHVTSIGGQSLDEIKQIVIQAIAAEYFAKAEELLQKASNLCPLPVGRKILDLFSPPDDTTKDPNQLDLFSPPPVIKKPRKKKS